MSDQRMLILQHEWADPQGYLGLLLQEKSLVYDVINVEKESLPEPGNYAAIVALGGPQHVYEKQKYPYFNAEEDMLRKVVEQDIPFLGVCLGGQLLASALGGTVKRHSVTEFGFYDIPLAEEGRADPLYAGFPGYHKVFHWHEDVFDLPQGAILLASNTIATNQAFRYGLRAYGIQYHIELTPEILHLWLHHIDTQGDDLDKGQIDALEQEGRRQFAQYQEHTRMMFENFLRISVLI